MNESGLTQAAAEVSPQRRRALLGGVAAAAGLAGVALGWWQIDRKSSGPASDSGLWTMKFEAPNGPAVDMSALRGRPLLLNFWATWCPPCVEELPLLDRFYQQNKKNGWQVLGLAIDQPNAVRQFLGQLPLSFPVGLAGMDGTALTRSLGNLSGGLPFTVVFDGGGLVAQRKMGKVATDDLTAWAGLR